MKIHNRILSLAALATLGIGVVNAAPQHAQHQQHGPRAHEAVTELAKARISLTQAIAAAEAHVPGRGRATKAELDVKLGKAVFEVEVVAGNNSVHEVDVDGVTGRVLSSRIDHDD